jgi:UDP-N-acetylmuramate dehydrogenase
MAHGPYAFGMSTRLAELTTLRLGGPARTLVTAQSEEELVAAVREADDAGTPVLVLAGGSNVVASDQGFDGTVVLVRTRGIEREDDGSHVMLRIQAGESWEELVESAVHGHLAGIECLSGIPGSTGATPIQNVGAYGQEIAETLFSVRVYDRQTGEVEDLPSEACDLTYRSSTFKRDPTRWVVLAVTLQLERNLRSRPIRYAQLANELGIEIGDSAPLSKVRDAVLALRRGKGMVLDPSDPDTASAGSFFINPVLEAVDFAVLQARVQERAGEAVRVPHWLEPDGRIKTSAAWLIERAGFPRGYGDPNGIAISSKHTLALTNRGEGTTADLLALAREIADGVREAYGVELVPEPVLLGERGPLPGLYEHPPTAT